MLILYDFKVMIELQCVLVKVLVLFLEQNSHQELLGQKDCIEPVLISELNQ